MTPLPPESVDRSRLGWCLAQFPWMPYIYPMYVLDLFLSIIALMLFTLVNSFPSCLTPAADSNLTIFSTPTSFLLLLQQSRLPRLALLRLLPLARSTSTKHPSDNLEILDQLIRS